MMRPLFLIFTLAALMNMQCVAVYDYKDRGAKENKNDYDFIDESSAPSIKSAPEAEAGRMSISREEAYMLEIYQQVKDFDSASVLIKSEDLTQVDIYANYKVYRSELHEVLLIPILRNQLRMIGGGNFNPREFDNNWRIAIRDEMGLPITQHEIRKRLFPFSGCIGCLLGGSLIIVPSFSIVGILNTFNKMNLNDRDAFIVGFGISVLTPVSMIAGYIIAKKRDLKNKINYIKKQRKMRELKPKE